MLLTDLHELKVYLELDPDDQAPDKILNFLVGVGSEWIEEWLGRPDMSYRQRTRYLDSPGTEKLLLPDRPAYYDADRPIEVIIDEGGGYGSVAGSFAGPALAYGTSYFLKIDSDDGAKSRCGILLRNGGTWPRKFGRGPGLLAPSLGVGRGVIKVTYYGGYTVDDLPSAFRFAVNTLVARMRFMLPQGFELSSDSYEEKSINIVRGERDWLMGPVIPLLLPYRNWTLGGLK